MQKADEAVLSDGQTPRHAAAGTGVTREALEVIGRGADLPRSVLVVEDNIILLMDTEEVLRDLGVAEVHTATSAAEALALIASQQLHFALLDVGLGHDTSFDIATRLHDLGIRFAFVTGYADRRILPQQFSHIPCLVKPHSVAALEAILTAEP